MCTEHGPSLSLDKQLCWFLEPKVLHASPHLCVDNHLLRGLDYGLRFLSLHQMGARHLLLFLKQ